MKTSNGILSRPSLGVVVMVGLTLWLTIPVQATLIDRGLFDDGLGGTMNLIYDDDLNVTWLGNANFGVGSAFDEGVPTLPGIMTWQNALDWADSLTVGAFTDWRLSPAFPTFGGGVNCTDCEMGHLYYTELGNAAFGPLMNTGPSATCRPAPIGRAQSLRPLLPKHGVSISGAAPKT